ncbi:MAG: hypothetical protein FJY98_03260 [Candidatus Liptonbacteria bacterium]|nr:hypothetical protein [Candidatus Liptonbacteria bacterium]
MKNSPNWFKSLLSAAGVFVYVSLVALFLSRAEKMFGAEDTFLMPIFMLLLFVVSASITGLLVLGGPTHRYLSGHKKEAFTLLFSTLGWLVVFLIIVAVALGVFAR